MLTHSTFGYHAITNEMCTTMPAFHTSGNLTCDRPRKTEPSTDMSQSAHPKGHAETKRDSEEGRRIQLQTKYSRATITFKSGLNIACLFDRNCVCVGYLVIWLIPFMWYTTFVTQASPTDRGQVANMQVGRHAKRTCTCRWGCTGESFLYKPEASKFRAM